MKMTFVLRWVLASGFIAGYALLCGTYLFRYGRTNLSDALEGFVL